NSSSVLASSSARSAALNSGRLFGSRMNRPIGLALLRIARSGGNDPDHVASHCVDHGKNAAIDQADRLAANLAVSWLEGVKVHPTGIKEHANCKRERNAVLGQIARCLGVIPLKRAPSGHAYSYGNSV